jgi:hypothetical protein
MTLSITTLCYYADCQYAKCHVLFAVLLSVGMLNVVVLNVVILSVIGRLSLTCKYYTNPNKRSSLFNPTVSEEEIKSYNFEPKL